MTRKSLARRVVLAVTVIATTGAVATASSQPAGAANLLSAHAGGTISRLMSPSGLRANPWAELLARPFGFASSSLFGGVPGAAPTVMVGENPVALAVDPTTHTLYVGNGNDGTVSVINDLSCNAKDLSGCAQAVVATFSVDSDGLLLVVDQAAHTLYVGQSNTVAMVNTRTCNASNFSGCAAMPPTAPVGSGPGFAALDTSTNTIYVPNLNENTVSVINGNTCNAAVQAGCAATGTVIAGSSATQVVVNDATHTAYVANYNDGTVTLIDTQTCNGTVRSGCTDSFPIVPVGPEASADVIDQASDTIYVEVGPVGDASLGSVAMIDGATCNVTDTSSCTTAQATTPDGSGPIAMTENPLTRTVYALNQGDDDMTVIDAATCNAADRTGCLANPPALAIGGQTTAQITPASEDGAGAVLVDPVTDTIYATSQDENNVSILNGASCNGTVTWGCTTFAPTTTVGNQPQGAASDPATNTVYVANRGDDTVSVIDAAVCNAFDRAGCGRAWPTFSVGNFAQDLRVDEETNTIYVVNANDNTVSVVNGATCDASDSSGCGQTPAVIHVGNVPYALAINQLTNTIYVANAGDDTVSVIDGDTCDGTNMTGCGQTPPAIAVGNNPDGITVDQTTDTVYVANGGDGTVSVIDGATCNAGRMSGCGQTPRTVNVGNGPYPIDVDQHTDTIYVGNLGDSTVSLINGATCNATYTGGCTQTPPAVPVEQLPFGITVDQQTDTVYASSVVDADIATINALACSATAQIDCRPTPIPERMGGYGDVIAVDPSANSAYVPDNEDGNVSYFPLRN